MVRNEGKICEAVIQVLEERESALRQNLQYPEKSYPNPAGAVEVTMQLGAKLFAIEHTLIEPLPDHIGLRQRVREFTTPLDAAIRDIVPPTGRLILTLPNLAFSRRPKPELKRIQQALIDWIQQEAPKLTQYPHPYDKRLKFPTIRPPGVDFGVRLGRFDNRIGFPELSYHILSWSGDLEQHRATRIAKACADKFPKLGHWKLEHGARTILVFEENDIQHTNDELVIDALHKALKTRTDRPDEIYLISTMANNWWLIPLVIDNRLDARWSRRLSKRIVWEFAPSNLTSITTRP